MPPTTNHAYINLPVQGKRRCRMLTEEARIFKAETEWLSKAAARKQGWQYEPGQRLSLSLCFHFNRNGKRDLDNRVKLLADSLAAGTGFDDSVIDRIELIRGNKTPLEFCEVVLEPLGRFMIHKQKADMIQWQETIEELLSEAPIALRFWDGGSTIELRQNSNSIMLNLETIPDLHKALKELAAKAKEEA